MFKFSNRVVFIRFHKGVLFLWLYSSFCKIEQERRIYVQKDGGWIYCKGASNNKVKVN